jgi:hypothetical protein
MRAARTDTQSALEDTKGDVICLSPFRASAALLHYLSISLSISVATLSLSDPLTRRRQLSPPSRIPRTRRALLQLRIELIATPALATQSRRAGITNTPRPSSFSSPPPCHACSRPAAALCNTLSCRAHCIGNPTPTFRSKQLPSRVCRVPWWGRLGWLLFARPWLASPSPMVRRHLPKQIMLECTHTHSHVQHSLIPSSLCTESLASPRMQHVYSQKSPVAQRRPAAI